MLIFKNGKNFITNPFLIEAFEFNFFFPSKDSDSCFESFFFGEFTPVTEVTECKEL